MNFRQTGPGRPSKPVQEASPNWRTVMSVVTRYMLCCCAPMSDIGLWRTASGLKPDSNHHSRAPIWRLGSKEPCLDLSFIRIMPLFTHYLFSLIIGIMNETKNCPYCGEEILAGAKKCKHCGEWLEEEPKPVTVKPEPQSPITVMARPTEQRFSQPIVINNTVSSRSNGIGTAGFVLTLISAIFCWVPGVNWIIWFLGALFSFIGLFKRPRGMAVAGFILSIIDVIIIVVVIGAVVGVASSLFS